MTLNLRPMPVAPLPAPAPAIPTQWVLTQFVARLEVNFDDVNPDTAMTWTANKHIQIMRRQTVQGDTMRPLLTGNKGVRVQFLIGSRLATTNSSDVYMKTQDKLVNLSGTTFFDRHQVMEHYSRPAPFTWDAGFGPWRSGGRWACTEYQEDVDLEQWSDLYYLRKHRQLTMRRKVPVSAASGFQSSVGLMGSPQVILGGTTFAPTVKLVCTHEEISQPDYPTGTWYQEQTWERFEALATVTDPYTL